MNPPPQEFFSSTSQANTLTTVKLSELTGREKAPGMVALAIYNLKAATARCDALLAVQERGGL